MISFIIQFLFYSKGMIPELYTSICDKWKQNEEVDQGSNQRKRIKTRIEKRREKFIKESQSLFLQFDQLSKSTSAILQVMILFGSSTACVQQALIVHIPPSLSSNTLDEDNLSRKQKFFQRISRQLIEIPWMIEVFPTSSKMFVLFRAHSSLSSDLEEYQINGLVPKQKFFLKQRKKLSLAELILGKQEEELQEDKEKRNGDSLWFQSKFSLFGCD
eukprot:TRINITY_DN3882_c0_g1_i5.p2 TRINITY_DN3882_c0_g1~~TRINITY_DN3882_c0_g1_i5.p2  ORF type:complete len:248 (+),score=66.91 TRINITY_DN3882_c0_g1_i5:99-746(+)